MTMPIAIKNEAGLSCRYGEDAEAIITEWWGADAEISYLDPGRTKAEVHRGGDHIAFVTVYYNTGEVGWKRHAESMLLVGHDEGGWLSGPSELVDRSAAT